MQTSQNFVGLALKGLRVLSSDEGLTLSSTVHMGFYFSSIIFKGATVGGLPTEKIDIN